MACPYGLLQFITHISVVLLHMRIVHLSWFAEWSGTILFVNATA